MFRNALGLIETQGLIAAIEATDAAAKAAGVVIASVEVTDAAYLTIRIEGDLGAVQTAVEAGARAARRVSELVAVHVIPCPDEGLAPILPRRRYVSGYHPDDDRLPQDMGNGEPDLPVGPPPPSSASGRGAAPVPETPAKKRARSTPPPARGPDETDLLKMTVPQLRRYTRRFKQLELKGREISTANKQQLIDAIKRVLQMD